MSHASNTPAPTQEWSTQYFLDVKQTKALKKKIPGWDFKIRRNATFHPHACLATERAIVESQMVYRLFKMGGGQATRGNATWPQTAKIVDVGGNAARHAAARRHLYVATLNPVVDEYDALRQNRGDVDTVETENTPAPHARLIEGDEKLDPAYATMSVHVYTLSPEDILTMVHTTQQGVHLSAMHTFTTLTEYIDGPVSKAMLRSVRGSMYNGEATWEYLTDGTMQFHPAGGAPYHHQVPSWVYENNYFEAITSVEGHDDVIAMEWAEIFTVGHTLVYKFVRCPRRASVPTPKRSWQKAVEDEADYSGDLNIPGSSVETHFTVMAGMSITVPRLYSAGPFTIAAGEQQVKAIVPKAMFSQLRSYIALNDRSPSTLQALRSLAYKVAQQHQMTPEESTEAIRLCVPLAFYIDVHRDAAHLAGVVQHNNAYALVKRLLSLQPTWSLESILLTALRNGALSYIALHVLHSLFTAYKVSQGNKPTTLSGAFGHVAEQIAAGRGWAWLGSRVVPVLSALKLIILNLPQGLSTWVRNGAVQARHFLHNLRPSAVGSFLRTPLMTHVAYMAALLAPMWSRHCFLVLGSSFLPQPLAVIAAGVFEEMAKLNGRNALLSAWTDSYFGVAEAVYRHCAGTLPFGLLSAASLGFHALNTGPLHLRVVRHMFWNLCALCGVPAPLVLAGLATKFPERWAEPAETALQRLGVSTQMPEGVYHLPLRLMEITTEASAPLRNAMTKLTLPSVPLPEPPALSRVVCQLWSVREAQPRSYASNTANDYAAIGGRAQLENVDHPASEDDYRLWLWRYRDVLFPGYNDELDIIAWDDWVALQPLNVRSVFEEARRQYVTEGMTDKDFDSAIFTKRELLPVDRKDGRDDKIPRAITKRKSKFKVATAQFFWSLSKRFVKMFGRNGWMLYAVGYTAEEIGVFFDQMTNIVNVTFALRDCSKWDATLGVDKIMTENAIARLFGADNFYPHGGELSITQLLTASINKKGRSPNGVIYTTSATRGSGDYWTTCLSTIQNMTRGCYQFCRQSGSDPIEIASMHAAGRPVYMSMSGGDDDVTAHTQLQRKFEPVVPKKIRDNTGWLISETVACPVEYKQKCTVRGWRAIKYIKPASLEDGCPHTPFMLFPETKAEVKLSDTRATPRNIDWDAGFKQMGFIPKTKTTTNPEEVDFYSGRPWPCIDSEGDIYTVWGPKIGRVLAKAGFSLDCEADDTLWQRGVAIQNARNYAHVPILRVMFRIIRESLADGPVKEDRESRYKVNTVAAHEAAEPECAAMFNHVYGFSYENLESWLEENLPGTPRPWHLANDLLDRVVAADL